MGQWGTSGALWGGGVAEAAYPGYHVIVGGVGLVLAQGGYERRLGQPYAAKLSTSQLSQADRINDQALVLHSWEGGEGYLRYESGTPDRYRRGAGIDVFTEVGAVGLGPYMSAIAGVTSLAKNEVTCLGTYKGLLMIGFSDGTVYQWDGSTLTFNYATTKAGGVRSMLSWNGTFYVGTGTDGSVFRWTGTTPTTTWAANYTVGPRSGDTVAAVPAHAQHLQEGGYNAFYGASEDGYGLVGQIANTSGTTDPLVALNTYEPKIAALLQYKNDLLALAYNSTDKRWALYRGDGSATIGWQREGVVEGGYGLCMALLDDRVFIGDAVQGRIWRYDGNDLELWHQLGSDQSPYTAQITSMVAWRGALWVAILDTDNTPALLRYAGGSWSRPVTGLSGTTPGPLMVYNDQLYYATAATGAARLYRTDGTFAASGWVESGLVNADLTGTAKQWVGVRVNHSALAATQSLEVQYRTEDTGSWTSLGTSSTDSETTAEFDFTGTITAEQIAFKLILTGTGGSSTQLKVFALVGRYKPSPGASHEWTMTVRLEGDTRGSLTLADGSTETRTGEELSAELWALLEANEDVNYVDIDREEYVVRITEYREALSTIRPNVNPLDSGWNLQGTLRLTEV